MQLGPVSLQMPLGEARLSGCQSQGSPHQLFQGPTVSGLWCTQSAPRALDKPSVCPRNNKPMAAGPYTEGQ